jgi:rhodanese-related sulfurtransferase
MNISFERIPPRDEKQIIPQFIADKKGLITVDVTWGKIQSIQAAEGVRTVGEQEVIVHLENGLPVIDVRAPDTRHGVRIPGTQTIPITDIVNRIDDLNRSDHTIFFCNGPQCPQSPTAINKLLDVGYSAEKMWYYRGGMHDWMTLGLPVVEDNE